MNQNGYLAHHYVKPNTVPTNLIPPCGLDSVKKSPLKHVRGMQRHVYKSPCSVSTLFLLGLIDANDILPSGYIPEQVRQAAEEQYMRMHASAEAQPRSNEQSDRRRRAHREVQRDTDECPDRPTELACCVCMTQKKTHACIPCFHLCLCASCARRVGEECPICRCQMERRPRVIYW